MKQYWIKYKCRTCYEYLSKRKRGKERKRKDKYETLGERTKTSLFVKLIFQNNVRFRY